MIHTNNRWTDATPILTQVPAAGSSAYFSHLIAYYLFDHKIYHNLVLIRKKPHWFGGNKYAESQLYIFKRTAENLVNIILINWS